MIKLLSTNTVCLASRFNVHGTFISKLLTQRIVRPKSSLCHECRLNRTSNEALLGLTIMYRRATGVKVHFTLNYKNNASRER